jgi:long-chain acyl-CoA synthetase
MLVATSGSTGDPKLVITTHGNLAYMSAAVAKRILLRADDIFCGVLPANHIFAWNGQGPDLWASIPMFLGHPLEFKQHIKRVHPTVLLLVPKIWATIMAELEKPPENWLLAKWKAALLARAFNPEKCLLNRILNAIASKMLAHALGGRLRLRITGGAAFPEELSRKFRVLGQKVDRGFGLSESTGATSITTPEHDVPGASGAPLDGVTVTFVPLPDGDGCEIVLSGPTISPGYWNRPDLTAQAFRDGAFYTGDIGRLVDGCIVVDGRIGEDGKLENGEKVSSAEIVEEFSESRLIQHVVPEFISRPYVTALIYLNVANARAILAAQGVANASLELLASSPVINAAVQAEIDRANDKIGEKGQYKRIRKSVIVPKIPTIENRLLSGKGEISAKVAKKAETALIASMY